LHQGELDVKNKWTDYGENPEIPVKITENTGSPVEAKKMFRRIRFDNH
jgi:hypothetical protein